MSVILCQILGVQVIYVEFSLTILVYDVSEDVSLSHVRAAAPSGDRC